MFKIKLISSSLTNIITIIIVISLIGIFSFFVFFFKPKLLIISLSNPIVDCNRGVARIYIEFTGKENITKDEISIFLDNRKIPSHLYELNSFIGYAEIVIPLGFGEEKDINELLLISYGKTFKIPIKHGCGKILLITIPPEFRNLSLVAYSSPHWVVLDYVNRRYLIYRSNNGDLISEQGPYEGNIPMYSGLYNFTIQTSSTSWSNRPIDSPVLIFINPDSSQLWIFNWTDPHGTFRFKIVPIYDAVEDFLIFWEDLFNPFSPPNSVDDWKDHVVRVTILPNNTYRVAVYLAKGGYKHQFFVFTASPDPLEGRLVYEKPYGQMFSNFVNGFYEEYSYWIIQLS